MQHYIHPESILGTHPKPGVNYIYLETKTVKFFPNIETSDKTTLAIVYKNILKNKPKKTENKQAICLKTFRKCSTNFGIIC